MVRTPVQVHSLSTVSSQMVRTPVQVHSLVERHLLHMNGVMPGLEYAPETPDPAALDAPLLEEDLPAEMPGQDDIIDD